MMEVLKAFIQLVLLHTFLNKCETRRLYRVKRGWFGNGKTSDVQCAFNPCSVSGFCGTGRTCEMEDNCRHRCECEPGSTHELCREIALPQTETPESTKCTFNPCASPAFSCNGGRKCVLDDLCMPECVCLNDSTHPSCVDDYMSTTKPTTDKATETDKCDAAGIACKHGQCILKGGQYTCTCEKGWSGDTCNESKCTMECTEGFYCHFVTPSVQICVGNTQEKTTVSVSLSTSTTDRSVNSNVCNDGYISPNHQGQICPSGTTCKYGVCDSNGDSETCKCDSGSFGKLCGYKCCRDCGHFGTCALNDEQEEICNCDDNYTGINCTETRPDTLNATQAPPEEVTWHYWVVGACVVVLLILIALMVIVPYILWRNRVILVMKFVHYFQGYEDDDDRQWDGFISYKSNKADEHFVVKTLFPMLEKEMGFKINVHFKDFLPGETIANNIITAVQCSRRTIMVISPSYVTSEFTKFEYQVAQQEMLKRKHRIIPILLDDISECKETMDPNLKVILNSVTYIEWPKDGDEKKLAKFWKRMELSMPKIKNRSQDIDKNKTQTNGVVRMTKPEDIDISVSNKKERNKSDSTHSNIYNMIDELKLDPEEVYDTLNESEMKSKVMRKSAKHQNGYNNTLEEDV